VHVSSIHAFQRLAEGQIVDETTPLAIDCSEGSYDQTKALGTVEILNAVAEGLDAVVACPTAVVGPYDFRGSLLGTALASFARRRLHVLVPGAYDFVDVRDVTDGLIRAAQYGQGGELYILSGTYASLPLAKAMVQEVADVHSGHVILPWRIALSLARVAELAYRTMRAKPKFTAYALRTLRESAHFSSEKARTKLGFTSRSLMTTFRDMLQWRYTRLSAQLT
jgi:dihydroflavonol-4-reductase